MSDSFAIDGERDVCCLVVNCRETVSYEVALTNHQSGDDGEIASEAACEGLSNLQLLNHSLKIHLLRVRVSGYISKQHCIG